MARIVGVNRSSALRLLNELAATEYVRRDPASRRYSLSPARFQALLRTSQADPADWRSIIEPLLARLRDDIGEATIMGVPAKGSMVYLSFFPSLHNITVSERVGTARPMHCSALGKAYLSALPSTARDALISSLDFGGGTDLAPSNAAELGKQIDEAQQRGYAIDRNETFAGGTCVAIPVTVNGAVLGALGVSGPSNRIDDDRIDEIGRTLLNAAAGEPYMSGS